MCLVNKNVFTIKCDDVCSICRGGARKDDVSNFIPAGSGCWNWHLLGSQLVPAAGVSRKPVAANFNIMRHSTDDLSIMAIEKLESKNPNLRKKNESYCSHHLQSLFPAGDEPGPVDMSSLCTPPPCTLQTSSYLMMNTSLFARHVDVLCIATYKSMSVCHNFVHHIGWSKWCAY